MPHDRPGPAQGCTEEETNTTGPADRARGKYQPAGLDQWGRRVRERYHAIADQAVKVGGLTRYTGDALCGCPGPWADIPDGLFAPLVSCRECRHIARRLHITITGSTP